MHLAGKGGLGGAEAPERRAGIVVGIDQTGPDGEVGDRVGPHRSRRAAEGHFRRLGGIGAVVPDHIGRTGDDGPVVHDAALEPEPSPHTGAAHTQDFFTAKDITYGASLGEHGACQSQHLGIQAALAAKTATLGRSDDADVFLSRIEDSRQFAQTPMRSIGGRPEGEMACYGIITRHTAERLHGTVRGGMREETMLEHMVSLGKGLFHIPKFIARLVTDIGMIKRRITRRITPVGVLVLMH